MGRRIILYDGMCGLCGRLVRFVHRVDRARIFLFVPLQSDEGEKLAARFDLKRDDLQTSITLIEEGRAVRYSTAILRILRGLPMPWKLAAALLIVPVPVRDWAYRIIARNRYRMFGRYEQCYLPPSGD